MKDYIIKKVKQLTKKYNTTSPTEIADALDIVVIQKKLGTVWGMYKYIRKNRVIFVNDDLSEEEKNFVLAHELGHAILHIKSSCFCYGLNVNNYKKEYEANFFSAQLLINNYDKKILKNLSENELAAYFKVPIELIKLKQSYLKQK